MQRVSCIFSKKGRNRKKEAGTRENGRRRGGRKGEKGMTARMEIDGTAGTGTGHFVLFGYCFPDAGCAIINNIKEKPLL